MKVKELRELLSFFDDEDEVAMAQPSNDYWGTTLARGVDSAEKVEVTFSAYHNTDKVVDLDRLDNYEKDELHEVVLLS